MKPKYTPPRPGFPPGPRSGSSPGWPVGADRPAPSPAKLTAGVPLARLVKRSLVNAPELVMLGGQKSPAADRFRQLRTLVADAGQVIVVTSPNRGDGRSLVAINLALAFCADPNDEILLIDADMRRPSLDDWLKPKPALGLTEVLEGRTELEHAILDIKDSPLRVLPAGAPVRDPLELISSPSAAAMMRELRQRYRKIIIDTPPVLPSIDASVIAKLGDGVLLIARSSATTMPSYRQAIDALAPTPIIGTVVNCAVPGLADRTWAPKTTPVPPVRRISATDKTGRQPVPIAPPEPRPSPRAESPVEALRLPMRDRPGAGESRKPRPLSLSEALAEPGPPSAQSSTGPGSRKSPSLSEALTKPRPSPAPRPARSGAPSRPEPTTRSKPRPLSDVLAGPNPPAETKSPTRPEPRTTMKPRPLSEAIGLTRPESAARTGQLSPTQPPLKARPSAGPTPVDEPALPTRTATPRPIAPAQQPARPTPTATSKPTVTPQQPVRPAPTSAPRPLTRPEPTVGPTRAAKPEPPARPAPKATPQPTAQPDPPTQAAPKAKPQPTPQPEPTAEPDPPTQAAPKVKRGPSTWPRPFGLRRKRGRSASPGQSSRPGGVSHDGSGGFVFSPPSKDDGNK